MKVSVKWLVLIIIPIGTILFFSVLFLRKSTTITLEDKFGTFSLDCRGYETGRGVGGYGFSVAYCNNKIKEMSNIVNYDEIGKFNLYLENKGLFNIANKVSEIEQILKTNDTKKYVHAVQQYKKEISLLGVMEKEVIISYFKM